LSTMKAEIWLNGTQIQPLSIEDSIDWSGGTNIEPARIHFSYQVRVIDHEKGGGPAKAVMETVTGHVTIGLLRATTTGQQYGFDIICNGRLLQRCVKAELGFCPKSKGGWGFSPSQKISMVRGVIYLCGPSKAMPWRSNKVEFDDEKLAPLRDVIVKNCKYWVDAGWQIQKLGTSKISGTLDHPFKGKIRTLTKAPASRYSPPTLVGPEEPHRIAFVTTERVIELAKRVFDLETDKDVNVKAKELFEDTVRNEASMYQGRRASQAVDYRKLSALGLTAKIRTKLGMAGVQTEELRDISKKEEGVAVRELQTLVEDLSASEAKKLYRGLLKTK